MKYCHDMGASLPTQEQAKEIVKALFYNASTGNYKDHPSSETWDSSVYKLNAELAIDKLGLQNYNKSTINIDSNLWIWLWSSDGENSRASSAGMLHFQKNRMTWQQDTNRGINGSKMILCVVK